MSNCLLQKWSKFKQAYKWTQKVCRNSGDRCRYHSNSRTQSTCTLQAPHWQVNWLSAILGKLVTCTHRSSTGHLFRQMAVDIGPHCIRSALSTSVHPYLDSKCRSLRTRVRSSTLHVNLQLHVRVHKSDINIPGKILAWILRAPIAHLKNWRAPFL